MLVSQEHLCAFFYRSPSFFPATVGTLCHLQNGGKVQCERLLRTPVLCLVIADGKCWEPEQIVMEKQDNCITLEIVTDECNTWVVSRCSTFVIRWNHRILRRHCQYLQSSLVRPSHKGIALFTSTAECSSLPPQSTWPSVIWEGSEGQTCSAAPGGSTRDLHRKTQKGVVGFRCPKMF